jgi:hypothetical protein
MASNGLVRVIGDGNNHWPLILRSRPCGSVPGLPATRRRRVSSLPNDEGDETVNDIIGAISPYLSHRPDVRYVPLEEARSKMGAYRRRACARSSGQEQALP